MGLDWQPLGKPKPGHEAEFDRLYDEIFYALRDTGPIHPGIRPKVQQVLQRGHGQFGR